MPSSLVYSLVPTPFTHFYVAFAERDVLCASKILITKGLFIFPEVFLLQNCISQ